MGIDSHFCLRQKLWCRHRLAGGKQQSTGLLHFYCSIPIKKEHHRVVVLSLERVMGIEPTSQAWEARILPMNYTRRNMAVL